MWYTCITVAIKVVVVVVKTSLYCVHITAKRLEVKSMCYIVLKSYTHCRIYKKWRILVLFIWFNTIALNCNVYIIINMPLGRTMKLIKDVVQMYPIPLKGLKCCLNRCHKKRNFSEPIFVFYVRVQTMLFVDSSWHMSSYLWQQCSG